LRLWLLTFTALLIVGLGATPAIAQVPDIDCDDPTRFSYYQTVLRSNPSDPHGLDADNDGIACDDFAPPGYRASAPNPLRRDVGYDSATGRTYQLAPYNSGATSEVLGVTSISPPRAGDAGLR
jgi:hypothetical protein